MSEDMKHKLRELSPFSVDDLTNENAVVDDLWKVYQLDKKVGDKMSMQRATLFGCIIFDSLDEKYSQQDDQFWSKTVPGKTEGA